MTIQDIIRHLEELAPPVYQESYDNSGLQTGNRNLDCSGALLTLDVTEAVLDEALAKNCNLVIAHHPVIFGGLKRLTGSSYTERIIEKAIRNNIAIYAIHTNLDNMRHGVNAMIAQKLGLKNTTILDMRSDTLRKLYTFVPADSADKVRDALFQAGAGSIGKYSECSFNSTGNGTFKPGQDADPEIGKAGGPREWVAEVKIEVLVRQDQEAKVLKALFENHPYEEVAYEFIHLHNANQEIGAGMIGELEAEMDPMIFLSFLKTQMKTDCIRYTKALGPIKKVALCGGSGSFLLKNALRAGADVFITGDFKYHQFFDAEDRIMIADIGHYESEQFTPLLIQGMLREKFHTFAVLLAEARTNPVNYFI